MRYRLMATYLGIPYHVGLGPDGNEATLFSPGPPPPELGFTAAGGHWRKQVSLTDLDALWQSRLVGEYRGEPCLVLDDLGDRLHIVYLGRDSARARQLGYWEIDREVFEVVVGRPDVTGLAEQRVEYPLASAMFPPSNRDPGPLRRRAGSQVGSLPRILAVTACQADTQRRIARRAHRTGPRPGTARLRERPGPSLSRRRSLSLGPRRRLSRRPGGAAGGGTGYPSRSSPNSSAWPLSRIRPTRSTRRCRAPCAWSRPTAASRCSALPTTPGWMCGSSKTRKRPTSTYLASWPRKPSAVGACAQARPTRASTDPVGPGCPRSRRKTFRSTYGAGNYPNRHLVQLSLISRRG